MTDEVTADRVAAIAAASRVPLDAATAARVARTVTPAVARFSASDIAVAFEVEPATFVVVLRQEARQ